MEGLRKIGTFLFDYIVITFLLSISLVLVFPFPFILTGVHNYFLYNFEDRRLANIFNILKGNWKILLKFSILWGVVVILSLFEIIFFNINDFRNDFLTTVCYVLLIFSLILITNAPMIVIRMNVNLKQLIFNGITLIFGCWWFILISLILTIGYFVAFVYFPYIGGIGLYIIAFIANHATRKAINNLKAKALKVNPSTIEEPENKDVATE